MPIALLLVAYLCCASLSLGGLAFLLYRYDRYSPEQRGIAGVTLCVGAATLACASLVWMEIRLAAPPTPSAVSAYAKNSIGGVGEEP